MSVAFQTASGNQDANATATNFTASFPASLAAGDTMVLAVAVWHTAATVNTPSGWTASPDNGTAGTGTYTTKVYVFTKVATSADVSAGSVAVTFAGSADYYAWGIARVSGADTGGPVHVHAAGPGSSGNGTTATAPSVTTAIDGCLILQCWFASYTAAAGSAAITPPATSATAHASGGGWCAMAISYQTQATHGATGTSSATLAKTGSWVAATIALAPPVPGTGFTGWGIPA